jgi:hypothetical protein
MALFQAFEQTALAYLIWEVNLNGLDADVLGARRHVGGGEDGFVEGKRVGFYLQIRNRGVCETSGN